MEKSNKIIRIYGKVHGVGFRYAAMQVANSLGIYGYVSNESDGSVYIESEGSIEQLEAFTNWCRIGPARAIVKEVKHFPGKLMNYTSFRIR